jgi:hypothetical protein
MESRQELAVGAAFEVEERGFAILDGMFSPIEMQKVIGYLEHSGLKRSKAGVRHSLRDAAVAALAADPRLVNVAQKVLGPEATAFRATIFDKSSQANWLVVWHQDTALPLRVRSEAKGWGPWSIKDGIIYAHAPASSLRQVLALRVHLDDSDVHNGPLRVLPGTHVNGVFSDDGIQQLAAQLAPVDCLVAQGGVLAMRPLILHASIASAAACGTHRIRDFQELGTRPRTRRRVSPNCPDTI